MRKSIAATLLALAVLFTFGGAHRTAALADRNRVERQFFGSRSYNPFYFYGPPVSPMSQYYVPSSFDFGGETEKPSQAQMRLNGIGINAINNVFFNNRILSLDSCTGSSGESGVCATRAVCSIFGGTSSGSCSLGRVCCINTANTCGKIITVNNTYWQSPSSISTPSTCSLNVKLDSRLVEQSTSICQVRLDFSEFTTAQPSATEGVIRGACDVDTFEVLGATNTVPVICGDNGGQHMYLSVTNSGTSASNLELKFKFGSLSKITRSWKIKIGFLPCYSDYLAPDGCLQYFTSSSGKITSFNFKDTTPASRKLTNQDYSMCFRQEIVNGLKANQLCLEECAVSEGNKAYRISANGDVSQLVDLLGFCQRDYLVFVGGTNSDGLSLDRFCGGAFNSASISAKASVCTKTTPFKVSFRTDGTEVVSVAADPIVPTDEVIGDDLNVGFCLKFEQKVVLS